jgi:hypothetical protein
MCSSQVTFSSERFDFVFENLFFSAVFALFEASPAGINVALMFANSIVVYEVKNNFEFFMTNRRFNDDVVNISAGNIKIKEFMERIFFEHKKA